MLLVSFTAAFANGGTGKATKYEVTMLKLELCTDAPLATEFDTTCIGAVVVGTGNKVFDIASVNVGASVGQFISAQAFQLALHLSMQSQHFYANLR